ncbi:2-C-methyl-D-erythritol 2,4-cyclodiphosphate synthase [Spiroplasma helicoides]|uniref:2-C-methyl-D-erythritol 2,4-cyclodiphosphate synthase n=1 Tax=Spiroplasma helicoides TaxID=216938 RepID=A0A1B3SMC5_9MOLU|nr:2-C-methyl-D-erythritol 2,4-cyclodiphosphate synthase [Spiroplasma helicoides]AOG61067.1 2-C-methyl-D-erythritol 2,4-cyclodiphosphate synthase [Spiroplasma helicoides]
MFRVGFSVDRHLLDWDKKGMNLGGLYFKDFPSTDAYSDGDAMLHSICEAFLGAMGFDDLGTYYNPETKPKNFSSLEIVADVNKLLTSYNYIISNIDVTVVLDEPSLVDHKRDLRTNVAKFFHISETQVSIKATRTEINDKSLITVYSNVSVCGRDQKNGQD